ncbi:MAG: ATP-binding protein [Peptoniphilaceae bacterium]|nr:ATP-binding protein [Peptoniphilaceae bacterium]
MLARTISCRSEGLETDPVTVEAEILSGFTQFTIVGLAGASIQEAKERIRAALHAMNLRMPLGRIIVNLYPGDLKKGGTQWDLAIAVALCGAMQRVPVAPLKHKAFIGALALDGHCRPVPGAYAMVHRLAEAGFSDVYLPCDNVDECRTIQGVRLYPCHQLAEVLHDLDGTRAITPVIGHAEAPCATRPPVGDYAELQHAEILKRVLTIAVAGRHHLLLIGPPGMGKSMALSRLPSVLPMLSAEADQEIRAFESVAQCGERPFGHMPFRPVSLPITAAALLGGGVPIYPGEITLAHRGVLVMDELPLFPTALLNQLRLPLEHQRISLSRGGRHLNVPADFQLMATANPCPCGYAGDSRHTCTCKAYQIQKYRQHIPAPVMDRIDLIVTLNDEDHGGSSQKPLNSFQMRLAIAKAMERQWERNGPGRYNARVTDDVTPKALGCASESQTLLSDVSTHFALSRRAARRILLVARTIADVDGEEMIQPNAILEAFQYRRAMGEWTQTS